MERYGRYLLLERIAHGGMGEVHRAVMLGVSGFFRQVAIKRIHPHLMSDPYTRETLVREARVVSELDHPNIIRVIELGEHEGVCFLAMEYVTGFTLVDLMRQALGQGRMLPAGLVLYVIHQALQGLAYAHARTDVNGKPLGIIHRDISPQNIMVSHEGDVQIVDFGIARAAFCTSGTEQGSMRGKPRYFSPEVVDGQCVTQALDVYAMGAVLYELLALAPMRVISHDQPGWWMQFHGAIPRIETRRPGIPTALAEMVHRAVAHDPADRFANAAEFAEATVQMSRTLQCSWQRGEVRAFLDAGFHDAMEVETAKRTAFKAQVQTWLNQSPSAGLMVPFSVSNSMITPPVTPAAVPPRPGLNLRRYVLWLAACIPLMGIVMCASQAARPFIRALQHDQVVQSTHAPIPLENCPVPVPPQEPLAVPRAAPVPQWGWLSVQSSPWARVIVDGRDTRSYTPAVRMRLASGSHRIKLVNDALDLSVTFTVDIPPGEHVNRAVKLR